MRKLSRAMMNAWKIRQAKNVQQGICPLCLRPFDFTNPKDIVIDHDHDTGEIRGALHRSCNSGEGKIANAAGSWIVKSMKYPDIVAGLERLLAYYKQPGTGMIYPTHKSAEETAEIRRNKRNLQAKERRATLKARKAMRDQRPTE